VVLPKPAGAEMSVTFGVRDRPRFKRSINRERRTMSGRGDGMYSLVARIGADMTALYNARACGSTA
jgi:hypothetical protein